MSDNYTRIVLTIIAVSVVWLAVRDIVGMPTGVKVDGFVDTWIQGHSIRHDSPIPVER